MQNKLLFKRLNDCFQTDYKKMRDKPKKKALNIKNIYYFSAWKKVITK